MAKRIETGTSITAQMTCLIRSMSYYEKNKIYRSDDYIAPELLSGFLSLLSRLAAFRTIYKHLAPKGIYEYVIARTKYIDGVYEVYKDKIEQVVILGAGFDSRSIRFNNKLKNVIFFEMDSPKTQESKLKRLKEKNINAPSNVKYIPINFNNETISQKLDEYGFKKEKISLFLLEGLTMYLNADSIDATFKLIYGCAAPGSIVVFDYIHASVLRQEDMYQDERKISGMVRVFGENWSFGIERGEAASFLMGYGFTLVDEADSLVLEKRFFYNAKRIPHVNETHSIITAKK